MLYENAHINIGQRITICQNPDLNRHTDIILNLDKVSHYSNYNRRTR